jgi:NADH:ubiquinone oxidoreductase subunit H
MFEKLKHLTPEKKKKIIIGHIVGMVGVLTSVLLLSYFGPIIHVWIKSDGFFQMMTVLFKVIIMLCKIICLLISIAYFTIAERKIMAAIQRRKGPDVVGPYGLLQPLADGLKLLLKEMLIPTRANAFIFILAPITILTLSLIS